ncbi:MAG: hypothetical protein RMN24_00720 [Anaerolineae bacterium]|nr:hypothetical protein [Caldilineales bacterium]MDW8267662.1 hypothetical protein [Anaerolineae bacterium]
MIPDRLFDLTALTTLAGLAAATYVLATTIAGLSGWPVRYVSAACALAISLATAYFTDWTPSGAFLAVLNAALAHLVATGAAAHTPSTTVKAIWHDRY